MIGPMLPPVSPILFDLHTIQIWQAYSRGTGGLSIVPATKPLEIFGRPMIPWRIAAAIEVRAGQAIWDGVTNEWRDVVSDAIRHSHHDVAIRVRADTATGTTLLFFKRSTALDVLPAIQKA